MNQRAGRRAPGPHASARSPASYDIERALRRVVETGEPMLDVDIALHGRRFEATYFAVRDDRGELLAVGKAMIDVTARRRAEAARERLQEATTALAGAVTVADVAARGDRAVAAGAGRGHGRGADARRRARPAADRRRPRPLGGRRASAGDAVTLDRADAGHATPRAPDGERVRRPTRRRCWSASPSWPGTPYPRAGAYAALPLRRLRAPLGVLSVGFARPVAVRRRRARAAERARGAGRDRDRPRAALRARAHGLADAAGVAAAAALPTVPGLDLAGRLESGAKGVEVGGDFYDAFALGDGAWGIAIGDVCGKGVDAAALTALARHTVRAAAHAYDSPAAVLEALNRAVLDREPPRPVPDRDLRPPDAARGRWLPLHARLRRASAAGRDRRRGRAAGARVRGHAAGRDRGPADRRHRRSTCSPGDTLLLYTDGLTEAERAAAHADARSRSRSCWPHARGETAAQTAAGLPRPARSQAGGGAPATTSLYSSSRSRPPALDRRENTRRGNLRHGDNVVR